MGPKPLVLILFLLSHAFAFTQYRVYGKITNIKLEPLAFVSVQVKDSRMGTTTKEDGSYELMLDEGRQDLVVSMIGFKSQVITIIVRKTGYVQNVILEEDDTKKMSEVVVTGKAKDRSEEIIRYVIRHKEKILSASGAWSSEVYIKATQEDSLTKKNKKKKVPDSVL